MASPAFRASTVTTYTSGRTTTTAVKPTGTAEGDTILLVLFQAASSAPTAPTPPSGFAQVGPTLTANDGSGFFGRFSVWEKKAGASEPASYDFTHSAASTQVQALAYSGTAAGTSAVDVIGSTTGTTGATATGPALTTTVAETKIVFLSHNWTGNPRTPPTGYTERVDSSVSYAADMDQATAGNVPAATFDPGNGSANPWSTFALALKPTTATPTYPAPIVVGTGSTDRALNQTTTTIPAPAGIAEGQTILAVMYHQSAGGIPGAFISVPSGFTQVGTDLVQVSSAINHYSRLTVFEKRATASEPASYAFSHPSMAVRIGFAIAISGTVSAATAVEASSRATGSGFTATSASVTTQTANDLLLLVEGTPRTNTMAAPSGWTQTAQLGNLAVFQTTQATPGASAPASNSVNTQATDAWLMLTLAIAPPSPAKALTQAIGTVCAGTASVLRGTAKSILAISGTSASASANRAYKLAIAALAATAAALAPAQRLARSLVATGTTTMQRFARQTRKPIKPVTTSTVGFKRAMARKLSVLSSSTPAMLRRAQISVVANVAGSTALAKGIATAITLTAAALTALTTLVSGGALIVSIGITAALAAQTALRRAIAAQRSVSATSTSATARTARKGLSVALASVPVIRRGISSRIAAGVTGSATFAKGLAQRILVVSSAAAAVYRGFSVRIVTTLGTALAWVASFFRPPPLAEVWHVTLGFEPWEIELPADASMLSEITLSAEPWEITLPADRNLEV